MSAQVPTAWRLLADNRGFRLLWSGTVVSFLGDWLTTVAVLTMVEELSQAATAVAAVLIAKTLPIFLIAPFAGPLADRVDRRLILIGTDLIRAVLVVGMIGAWWTENLAILLVLLTLRTFSAGCFIPARTASIPDLTRELEMPVAVALMGGTWSVMLAVGAATGGLLTQVVGITGALVVDAMSFLLSAALLWGLPSLPPSDGHAERDSSFIGGLRALSGRVYLPALLLLKPAISISGAVLVLLPTFAGGRFVGYEGPFFLGLLYAGRGLGALVGSMGIRRIVGDAPQTMQRMIVPAFVSFGVLYAAMGWSTDYWVTLACLGFATVGSGMVWTFSGTLGQLATTREIRGRVFAMEFGLTMLGSSLASLAGGLLLDAGVTVRALTTGIGMLCMLPAVAWAMVLRFAPDRIV